MLKEPVFLTGATGFMGSVVLSSLLRQGHAVHALARSRDGVSAVERVRRTVQDYDPQTSQRRLRVYEGDITLPLCGLEPDVARRIMAETPIVLHLAASLRYRDHERETILRHNLEGTQNVLDLLQLANDPTRVHLCYVSTAYVCGRTTTSVPERLHDPERAFNNMYEMSKTLAEHLVARDSRTYGFPLTIIRPAIVVGDSRLGWSCGGTGYYSFLKTLWKLSRSMRTPPIRILGRSRLPLHLIPVDFVAETILRLLRPGADGLRVVHVVPERPPTVGKAFETLRESLGYYGMEMVSPEECPPSRLIPLEREINSLLQFHAPYLLQEYRFATRSLRQIMPVSPHVDSTLFLKRLNKYFLGTLEAAYAASC